MKLSEMNTVELAKALCNLAAPVGRLVGDKELMKALGEKGKKDASLGEKLGKQIPKVIPSLLGDHFEDVVLILSTLTGKAPEAIRQQKGAETISDLMQCFDKDLLDFFKPSASMEQTEFQE